MGRRAACIEKTEGAPADEPPYLMVGGKRAPLSRLGQSLSGVCVCVCARACMSNHSTIHKRPRRTGIL